jgi:hypothetical protein
MATICVLVPRDELPQVQAELVVGVGETWWNSSTAISRSSNASTPNLSTAKRKVAWVQTSTLSSLSRKRADRLDLAAVVVARRVAQVPLAARPPVGPEAVLGQRLIVEAGADGLFRHDDDGLLQALVVQLVERDKHQRAALARGRRRLDEQVLLAALLIGALLHRPHAQGIGLGRCAVARIGDGDGRADAQPVQPQRVAAGDPVLVSQRQELGQGQLLPAIEHVALVLGDDQRQARDLRRKVAQFDAPKVGERDFAARSARRAAG